MGHEYGAFGSADRPVQWILQHIQLANGWTVQNVEVLSNGNSPQANAPVPGYATVQSPEGKIYFVAATTTLIPGSTWTSSRSDKTYSTSFQVNIPLFNARIVVTALVNPQEFVLGPASVYEGVADHGDLRRSRNLSLGNIVVHGLLRLVVIGSSTVGALCDSVVMPAIDHVR